MAANLIVIWLLVNALIVAVLTPEAEYQRLARALARKS